MLVLALRETDDKYELAAVVSFRKVGPLLHGLGAIGAWSAECHQRAQFEMASARLACASGKFRTEQQTSSLLPGAEVGKQTRFTSVADGPGALRLSGCGNVL